MPDRKTELSTWTSLLNLHWILSTGLLWKFVKHTRHKSPILTSDEDDVDDEGESTDFNRTSKCPETVDWNKQQNAKHAPKIKIN